MFYLRIAGFVMLLLSFACSSKSRNLSSLQEAKGFKSYFNVFGVDKPSADLPAKKTVWFGTKSDCLKQRLNTLKGLLREDLSLSVIVGGGMFSGEYFLKDLVRETGFIESYEERTFSFPDGDTVSKIGKCHLWPKK